MAKTRLFMESTEVPAERTAAELRVELVKGGAGKIMEEYADGRIVAITFSVAVNGTDLPFRLPVRPEPIFAVLNKRRRPTWDQKRKAAEMAKDREQAGRIAWRQVYRWVQAQIALCATGMASVQEVFFPYLTTGVSTVYELALQSGFKALPAPQQEREA